LIYFAHGWALALANVPLIDERPQAWDFGPVIPAIYHQFKEFGRHPISQRAEKLVPHREEELPPHWSDIERLLSLTWESIEPQIEGDPDAEALLTRVWEVYSPFSAAQLSNMTHTPGSAWDEAYKKASGRRGMEISDALIHAEFKQKARGGRARADAAFS